MDIPTDKTLEKYGLTTFQYIDLWNLTNGHCPLCGKHYSKVRPACIDHDHKTFTVRGLLCRPCNYELGVLHENVTWLDNAVRYLRFPPTRQLWAEQPRVANAPPVMETDR